MIASLPLALSFPDISPDIFTIPVIGFAVKWYAMAYIAGILGGWVMGRWLVSRPGLWPGNTSPMRREQIEDVMTWVVLGIVLGGRIGYVLFYQPEIIFGAPLQILNLRAGGMSFHGGAIGTGLAVGIYAWRKGISVPAIVDVASLCAPLGLGLGRVANFINGELWGRPSDVPWAVIFPGNAAQSCANVGEFCARHPSQLYQATLEGLVLLVVLWVVALRGGLKTPGLVFGLFLVGYGAARTFVEYFRQADAQYITPGNPLGHVVGTPEIGLTMGQLLSLPMVAAGVVVLTIALRARRA